MDINEVALQKHREWRGKIDVSARVEIENKEDLAIAYTPGVAAPCIEISKNEDKAYEYTSKGNLVAVITDGTAVLGLGDIGPSAAMPVMEGKCNIFKRFAGIDAFPLCIDSKDTETIVQTILNVSKSFGGINLEDISAPRCFEIEKRLIELCEIPVFHDDQHGTAIIAAAGLLNAIKYTGKKMGDLKIVINGAGAAGISVAKMLLKIGFEEITLCDSTGIIYDGSPTNNLPKSEIAKLTNKKKMTGKLSDALKGADVLIGVSKPGVVNKEMVMSMAKEPIIFALANPVPEILPDEAKQAGAAVVATGRSDFPNQVNNALCFPGIFRGALDVRARYITEEMKVAAAFAIAEVVSETELSSDYILPDAFDPKVVKAVASAVSAEAVRQGINRV